MIDCFFFQLKKETQIGREIDRNTTRNVRHEMCLKTKIAALAALTTCHQQQQHGSGSNSSNNNYNTPAPSSALHSAILMYERIALCPSVCTYGCLCVCAFVWTLLCMRAILSHMGTYSICALFFAAAAMNIAKVFPCLFICLFACLPAWYCQRATGARLCVCMYVCWIVHAHHEKKVKSRESTSRI